MPLQVWQGRWYECNSCCSWDNSSNVEYREEKNYDDGTCWIRHSSDVIECLEWENTPVVVNRDVIREMV